MEVSDEVSESVVVGQGQSAKSYLQHLQTLCHWVTLWGKRGKEREGEGRRGKGGKEREGKGRRGEERGREERRGKERGREGRRGKEREGEGRRGEEREGDSYLAPRTQGTHSPKSPYVLTLMTVLCLHTAYSCTVRDESVLCSMNIIQSHSHPNNIPKEFFTSKKLILCTTGGYSHTYYHSIGPVT